MYIKKKNSQEPLSQKNSNSLWSLQTVQNQVCENSGGYGGVTKGKIPFTHVYIRKISKMF
jgi:hypothetical protein